MSGVHRTRRKALLLALSMASAAAVAMVARPRRAADARAVALETLFPARLGAWQLDRLQDVFVRPADQQGKFYGIYDQVLERIYIGPEGERVMLSVVYGSEQTAALQVHRPEICYAGGGFVVSGLHRALIRAAERDIAVTRLLAARPGRSEPVTYWVLLGDAMVGEGGAFRWRQIVEGLKGHVLDGLLVRVSSIDTDERRAYAMHERFARALVEALSAEQRARVIGAGASPG